MVEPLPPPKGVYTRRRFLRAAGYSAIAVAGGGLVAACSQAVSSTGATAAPSAVGSGNPSDGVASPSPATVGGPLNIFTWGGYEGSGTIDDWYSANGIELNAKAITTPGGIPPAIQQGGWDASSVNQGDAEYYHELGISSEITVDEVPGLAKMLPFFRDGSLFRIREGVYNSVPWTWGPIGFMARPDRIPEGSITSYFDLTKPEFKGRLETFDDPLNMVATGAVAQGLDPGALTREQLNGPVRDYLEQIRPSLKILATSLGDQINNLAAGDVDGSLVGFAWGVFEVKKLNVDAYFLVPEKEGAFGFCDAVFIPPNAEHRANAIAYCNALLEGDTAAAFQDGFIQLSTNPEVIDQARAEVRAVYPRDLDVYTNDTLKWNKSYYDPAGQYATIEEWTALWEEVKVQS